MSLRVGRGRGGVTDHTVLPGLPVIVSPAPGAVDIDEYAALPVITALPDFGAGATAYVHAATEIAVYRVADRAKIFYGGAEDPTVIVPAGTLARETEYAVRTRHQGESGWWTNWSGFSRFTTLAAPDWFAEIGAPADAISVWDWVGGRAHNAGFYFKRPSPAYDLSAGVWTEYPADHLRIRSGAGILIEPAARNLVRNAAAEGGGVDQLPDGWTMSDPQVHPISMDAAAYDGLTGVGIGISAGSPSGDGDIVLIPSVSEEFPAQTKITLSLFCRMEAHGAGAVIGNTFLRVEYHNAQGGISVQQHNIGQFPQNSVGRRFATFTTPAGTVRVKLLILARMFDSSNYLTHILQCMAPQLELGEVATSPMPGGAGEMYERAADDLTLYCLPGAKRLVTTFADGTAREDVVDGDFNIDPTVLANPLIKHHWTVAA